MGNRISTEDLYKITQSLADRAVSDVKKRREDERKREEAIKKNREERLAAAAKQNRIPNYKGGSLWDQYKAALASGEAKNASDFITKRDARNAAWNKVGAETLNDDMEALAKNISSTYGTQFDPSKYYSQETINGSSDQVKKMRDRLNALAEYYNAYGGSDDQKKAVGEQIKAYDSELKFLGDLGAHYGQYSSPEAYETLYDNGLYTEKYQGKNYSDIQNALKSTTNDREKAWLEKNADSFMTAAEAQAEIDRIEKAMGTKNIAGQRWTTGFPKIENGKLVYNDNLYDKETGKRLQKLEAIRDSKINKETLEDYGRYLGEANEFATERALFLAKQNNILQHGNETFGVFAPDAKAPYAKNENAQNEASRLSPEKLKAVNEQSGQAFSFLDNADWATDDEKKIYDYLLYYKGGEEAKKYLRALSYELNRRAANALDQTVSDMYDKASGLGKTVLNIGSLGMNIIGNPEAAIDTIAHRIVGERVDPNSNNQTFRRIRNVIREKTGADLAKASEGTIFGKELFGENAANMLYGAAMSSLDSLLGGFTFGEGYTAVMGGGAMADEAERLYNKGASDSQIFNRSFAAGLAEYITEKVSMDNLLKAKSPANGLQVAKEILKQAGIEGSEEMASDVLNLVADSIIMADRSEMSESIQKYKDGYIDDNGTYHKGVSEKEAQKLAWQDFFTDAMADGLAGALSGGMMSAGPTISSYKYSKNRAAIQIPSIDPGNAEGLVSNARINDISVLTDVSEALKNGDAEEAGGVISEGIAWYEFLKKYGEKTYGKNQWSEVRGSIDDSISKLKKIQKLVADGSIDAAAIDEVLKTAETSMKTTPTVDVTSANDEKLFSLLAKGEPSNKDIERNILKDRGTLAAFERLTGLRIGGTTVSQKRADVREAFRAVSSSTETLKAAQNAIESGATATEGHKNAAVIIDQAIQANRAENSRLRNSEKVKSAETKAAIDATNRQHRFLETVRNYVINGGDLSGFTESPVSNVFGEGGTNSSETKTTQETAKKRVRADFSAYQDEIIATEYNKAVKGSAAEQYTYFSNEEKKLNSDIKNIAESEAMTAEEKAEAIEKKNEEKNRLYALAKSTENVREMMRVKYAGNVDRLVEELQPKLKKYGIKIDVVDNIDAAGKSSSGAYFDRNTNTIKVSRNWDNFNNVVKLVLSGEGLAVTDRASVSFDRAVTQTIAHEIAHADSGLTLDFIKAVAGTQYDAFDLKGRLEHPDDRSWRSEDAQKEKNWRRYVDAYTEQAMLEMKGTEEQRRASAEKVVNDAYIFEEIMADMFGAAVDDMGHSSKAGENIFWAMNRNKPGIIKRILNALERFVARIRGKDAYLAVEQRQAAERLRDMLTGELKRAYGTDVKGEAAVESDGGKRYSISKSFVKNYDAWDKQSVGGYFKLGTTSAALESVGINPANIYWYKSKIKEIKAKHPEMTDAVIKQVPELLENPVIIMQSQTVTNRATVLGDLDAGGKPVLCALELKPDGNISNFIVIASAYPKSAVQNLINTSDILYVDPNKNRTDSWLSSRGLQLPEGVTNYGSIGSISYTDKNVKGQIVFGEEKNVKTAMQEALEKAGVTKEGKRFSLSSNVEQTKDLIAVHNMTAAELEKSLDLGGLPMPSIAIIKAADGHSEYGDVSLVFGKDTIDPKKSARNKVYGGDAWTPEFPEIDYKANEKVGKRIRDKYYDLSRKYGYDNARALYDYAQDLSDVLTSEGGEKAMIDKLYGDTGMMQIYLMDTGRERVANVNKETKTALTDGQVRQYKNLIDTLGRDEMNGFAKKDGEELSDLVRRRKAFIEENEAGIRKAFEKTFVEDGMSAKDAAEVSAELALSDLRKYVLDTFNYIKNGAETVKTEFDAEATDAAIKKAADGEGYRKWVNDLFGGAEEKSGIRNSKDAYTASGNRRSFEALHWENNLENIVKAMLEQDETGGAFFSGTGIWGVSAKKYNSISEIKNDSSRLRTMNEAEYNALKEQYGARMQEIAQTLIDPKNDNYFIASDDAYSLIVDAVRNSKDESGILRYLKKYNSRATEKTASDIAALVRDIAEMPTGYFEAKPQRAVGFDEVKAVILPDNASGELVSRLESDGINTVTYKAGDENSRLEALNGVRDVRFSLARANGITTEITDDSYDEYEGGYQRRDIKLNGETVGTVAIRIYDDYSEIDRIDIDEKYRNKSIGTTVLGDIAGEFDTTYIVPDNESAKRLYERIGEEVTSGEVYENLDQGYGVYRLDKSYGNTRWSLVGTTDGRPVAVIDKDILDGVPESEWKSVARKAISEGFPDGIAVQGKNIRVNQTTRREYTKSDYTQWLFNHSKGVFADKMRAAAKLDDVVLAATNWTKDGGLKHPRKDNFVDFGRGNVLMSIGGNKYSAEVILAYPQVGSPVLYDVVTLNPDSFDLINEKAASANANAAASGAHTTRFSSDISAPNTVSLTQNTPDVNSQYMREDEKDSSDERHSLVKSAQSELKALQKENEKLRQDVDDLKQELQLTHGRKLSRDALISSIQKILIDRYGVKLSAKELYPHVTNLFDMFYNNTVDGKRLKKDERVDTMRIIEEMDKIVDAVIENAVGVDDTYVEMKKLLPELRNTKLVVPMDARADAAQSAGFENWAEFRKANFGRVGFANEGLPVDTYYMELSERYPELFPDGITNPGEQAAHIADVVNTIRESGINEYQLYDIEDERIRTSIKNDVMDIIGNAEKLQTFADRAAQKVEDTKLAEAMHYGADIAKLKRLNAEKVADIKAENRKRLSDMRRKYQDRVESVRERYAEARANRSEKQKQTVLRNKVLRKYTEASSMLDRPTTENHFTEAMRKPLMEFLAAVDITTGKSVAKQGVYDRILRVIEAANNMAAEDGKNGLDIAETDLNVQEKQLIVDSGLLERMSAWVKANQGKKLTELSSAQLEELNGIFNQLKHLTAEIKRLYDPREGLAAKSWQAQKEIGLAQIKERKQVLGAKTERARGMYEQVHFGALDPSGYYNTLGSDTMTAQFERFRQCQNRFSENIQMFTDRLGEIVDGAIPKDEHGKNAKEVTLKLSHGTLTATPAQLMSIHLMLNQEDSRRCLFNEAGGVVIGKFTAERPKDGKAHIAGKRTFAQSGSLVLNEADAAKITAALTDGQRKRADAISALLNNEAARLGNEVSMAMYGYKKYTTENYFPMRTADDYRAIADNPNYEMNLLGLSFTKERTGRAGKALVAEDIYDVIGRHLTNMAQYNAFAQELDNAKKMYSLRLGDGTSLKQRIIRSYGREADAFYNKLINNLSGVQMYTNNSAEALSDKLLSNYKAAAVAGNVSVVLKQPMSIFRALPEFSLSGLKKSMAFEDILNLSPKQLEANTAEMLKYSGIARLKAWGSSENMTRKSFESLYNDNSDTARQKINEFLTSGAENADMWTWAKLWRMSKAEIDAQGKYTAGSKEYFEAVDRKFSDVIGKTQVVQSALDSSMAVQNAKGFGKFLFAFQNEPLKQYSYLISTLNDARRGKPGAKKKLAKVIASSLANTAAVSAISTFMAWLRGTLDRDDDDELLDDLMKEFAGNSIDDLLSGAFAPVWQYIDTIMGAINSGVYGNTVERLDMAALTDLGGLINKYFISQNGGRPNLGTVQDIVNVASNLFGLPAKNIFRDVKSVIDRIILELPVPSAAKYNYLKAWKDVELTNKAAVTEAYYDVLRDAVDRGRYSDYVKIKRDMIYHGYTETKIKNAVMKSSLMDDLYELKKVNPGSYKAKVNSIVSSVSAVSSLEGKEFEDFIESAMKRREREDGGSKTDDEVYDEMHRKMEKEVKEQLIYIDVSNRAAYIKKMLKTYGEYGITEADILKVLRKAGKA